MAIKIVFKYHGSHFEGSIIGYSAIIFSCNSK